MASASTAVSDRSREHGGTPDEAPWNVRVHEQRHADPSRSSYDVDRDRIVHSSTFRDLQYKTQVQSLLGQKPSMAFRTRLNHVIEVSQIARALGRLVGADEALCEAIALAHDLGHPPFGHAGERALSDALRSRGREGWNANVHSLEVVDRIEEAFASFRGLNLTFAVREGVARHSTPFDEPVSFGEFVTTANGGLECQIVDVADVFAYLSHDLDDALAAGFISFGDLEHLATFAELVEYAEGAWAREQQSVWPGREQGVIVRKTVIGTLLHRLITGTGSQTVKLLDEWEIRSPAAVRERSDRVVTPAEGHEQLVRELLDVLIHRYYRSSEVADADTAAKRLVGGLLESLVDSPDLIPERFRDGDVVLDAATYIASLNDFAAAELAGSQGVPLPRD
jgi:dGTPase